MAASRACPQDAETTLSATGMVFDLQPCDNYRTMTASSAHSAAAMQHPTAAELAILKLLWSRQPLSYMMDARWGYSSTRKTLARMAQKGQLSFTSLGHKNSYSAKVDKVTTLAGCAQ